MRVVTWNLLHGVALTDPTDAPDLAQVANSITADLIGLQEVDRNQIRSDYAHQTKIVADAMGLPFWVFAPAITGTPGEIWESAADSHIDSHEQSGATPAETKLAETKLAESQSAQPHQLAQPQYGVGLASRYPMTNIEVMRFKAAPISLPLLIPSDPKPRWIKVADEPRVAIIADVETPLGIYTVATAHLSFVPGFNIKQLRKLTKHLSDRSNPILIFGDFNLPGKIAKFVSRWDTLAELPTYPTFKPRIQFDHVISRGLSIEAIAQTRTSAEALQLAISDHCALVVEITK